MSTAQTPTPSLPASLRHERSDDNAFRALVRTLGLLERVMQPYFARFGISGSQWGVLRTLHRAAAEPAGGLRLTDLSARLLIRPPSVTGVIDRLERVGLVAREAVPGDLRAKLVKLTPRGIKLVDEVLQGHQQQMDAVLGGLNPAEQIELHRLLDRLDRHIEQLLDSPTPPPPISAAAEQR